jgi:two-component system, repressor protein LuxO
LEIAQAMLLRYSSEEGKKFKRFSEDCCAALLARQWPGNVRELINVVRAAVALHDGETVELQMLSPAQAPAGPLDGSGLASQSMPVPAATIGSGAALIDDKQRIKPLALVEREAIEAALRAFGGNVTRAAKALEVNPSTIHRKMSAWG